MTINKINLQSPVQNFAMQNTKTQQNPAFKGRTDIIQYALHMKNPKISNHRFKNNVSYFLNVSKGLSKYTTAFKRYKMDFMFDLSEKYYYDIQKEGAEKLKLNKNIVFRIYDKVKNPGDLHKKLINGQYNFKQMENIVDLTKDNPHNLKLAQKLLTEYPQLSYEKLENFLKSPLSKQINKNYNDYKPYLKLHINQDDVVQGLEQKIEQGYDKKYFVAMNKLFDLKERYHVIEQLDTDKLLKNYTEEKFEVLHKTARAYASISKNELPELGGDDKTIEFIYNTTTRQNAPYRKKVLGFVERNINFENKPEAAPIKTLLEIFKEISLNPKARTYLEAFNTNTSRFAPASGIKTLDDLLAAMREGIKEDLSKSNFFKNLFKNS